MSTQTNLDELNMLPPRPDRLIYQRLPRFPTPPPIIIRQAPTAENLQQYCSFHSMLLTPTRQYSDLLAYSIVKRMCARVGSDVYQSTAFKLSLFTRAAFTELFPGKESWRMATASPEDIPALLTPFEDIRHNSAGQSRAVKPPSEVLTRVVAVLIGLTLVSIVSYKPRREMIKVTMMYCLVDEVGEVHPPKNKDRQEIGLQDEERQRVRDIALTDATKMAISGTLFSTAWLQRMGPAFAPHLAAAQVMEARLATGQPALEKEGEDGEGSDEEGEDPPSDPVPGLPDQGGLSLPAAGLLQMQQQ